MNKRRTTGVAAAVMVPLSVAALLVSMNSTAAETVAFAPSSPVPSTSPSPTWSPSPSLSPSPSASPTHKPSPKPKAKVPTRKPAPRKASVPSKPKVQSPKTYNLYPVTAFGSQATIDKGKLVTWMTSPTCLLAGHNTMGWSYLDDIPNGSIVNVKSGPCKGKYKVVTHRSQSRKGGPVPSWMSNYDLVLQTCKTVGMGFSAAKRI